MSKTIAILQSNYIPWKGYFDIIAAVDEFIVFDEVQYTRRDWRNRNRVIVDGAPRWLTIPVATKGNYDEPINVIKVADPSWAGKHWATLRHAYGKAQYFDSNAPALADAYRRAAELESLTAINQLFLNVLCDLLELSAVFTRSDQVPRTAGSPTGRLVELCKARGGDIYVSGPAARSYIERDLFAAAGVALCYTDYSGYPTYDQGMAPFEHGVSVLDTLFRCGPSARDHLKSLRDRASFLQPEG